MCLSLVCVVVGGWCDGDAVRRDAEASVRVRRGLAVIGVGCLKASQDAGVQGRHRPTKAMNVPLHVLPLVLVIMVEGKKPSFSCISVIKKALCSGEAPSEACRRSSSKSKVEYLECSCCVRGQAFSVVHASGLGKKGVGQAFDARVCQGTLAAVAAACALLHTTDTKPKRKIDGRNTATRAGTPPQPHPPLPSLHPITTQGIF